MDAPEQIVTYRTHSGRTSSFPAYSAGGPPEFAKIDHHFGTWRTAPREQTLVYGLESKPHEYARLIRDTGHRPILCYPSFNDRAETFAAGDHSFLTACMTGLGVVDEDSLTWEQVLAIREDLESRAALIRFQNWLCGMHGKSKGEIEDNLATLLDRRNHALRKFGVVLFEGGMIAICTPITAMRDGAIASTTLGGMLWLAEKDPVWALSGMAITVAQGVVATVRKTLSALQNDNDAVAYIQSVRSIIKHTRRAESAP